MFSFKTIIISILGKWYKKGRVMFSHLLPLVPAFYCCWHGVWWLGYHFCLGVRIYNEKYWADDKKCKKGECSLTSPFHQGHYFVLSMTDRVKMASPDSVWKLRYLPWHQCIITYSKNKLRMRSTFFSPCAHGMCSFLLLAAGERCSISAINMLAEVWTKACLLHKYFHEKFKA